MAKKPNLASALHQAAGRAAAEPVAEAPRAAARSRTREGTKTIAGHFDPAVSRQLKALALDRDTTVQELLREALNDLFEKHGASRIA